MTILSTFLLIFFIIFVNTCNRFRNAFVFLSNLADRLQKSTSVANNIFYLLFLCSISQLHTVKAPRWTSPMSTQLRTRGPGFRTRCRNIVMFVDGTWSMQNPSWVQFPSGSHLNYTSGGSKAGELSPPWKIRTVMACYRTILRDESHTVRNSPLRSYSPTLNSTNQL